MHEESAKVTKQKDEENSAVTFLDKKFVKLYNNFYITLI